MAIRGVRGATVAAADTAEAIRDATRELLARLIELNGLEPEDVASIFFTCTPDITAEYPAMTARQMGWVETPLICGQEMRVPGSLPMCIRVLLHWNTDLPQKLVRHAYLREATALRPDIARP
ncbi:MAG: chorismate mutase [Anaerolineales bacterium]|nr:chorismate mutase [Anaerolineales bacterium]